MVDSQLRGREEIRPVKRAVEDQLLALPGVVAVDIGEKRVAGVGTGRQAIVVSVDGKSSDEQLCLAARVPATVCGIATDVIEERALVQRDHSWVPGVAALNSQTRRIVAGGDGIAAARPVTPLPVTQHARPAGEWRRVGTLGVLVAARDHGPTAPSDTVATMGLTTFDVACVDDAWAVGDEMVDPRGEGAYARLARAALSAKVDAAAVTLDPDTDHTRGIYGIGPVAGHRAARLGSTVHKYGHGTGLTSATVTSTDASVRIDHGAALGVRTLRDQVRVTTPAAHVRFAGAGDAGAVLVDLGGYVVGLHVAGSRDGSTGFASPIADVLHELDVELCAGASVPGWFGQSPSERR